MNPSLENEINLLHSQICGALADPKRILILYTLSEQSMSVTEISQRLQIPQPTVSRHLKTLRERGLVNAIRDGQSVYYSLADRRVIDALDTLREVLADLLESQRSLADSFSPSIANESESQEGIE
ncbi:MAG: metalloregulator ArsR/SmtB family transcription factor [Anaerolineales bacterium]|nr:metalloregulator ArsR/SmtB family transcription factor [Anaerolineales bacterium]